MKRIASILIVLALSALMLTGCSDTADETDNGGMGSADITAANSDTDTTTVSPDDYEKTFEGFIQYMTDGKFIKGEGTDLTASAIGAKQGKRFVMSGTSKYSVELYEYEDQTSEIAQKTIANARGDHSFHLMDSTESATANTYAAVTEDGRFLMLYTDGSTNNNPTDKKIFAYNAVVSFK